MTPDQAFQELAGILSTRHNHNQILEIEILPSDFGPLLHDECSVGITKKVLVQAFVAARRVFFENENGNGNLADGKKYKDESLLRSSEIILLFAPEHLTACNWRKGRLFWILQNTSTKTDDAHRQDILETLDRELTLMTTYLCSPLHRHTKSPTLWQHRFWVLCQIRSLRGWTSQPSQHHSNLIPQQVKEPESIQSLLQSELSIVLRAGELHPRNYYAFNYIRQLHTLPFPPLPPKPTTENKKQDISVSLLDQTMSWCLAHPRDISGWTFALYLLEAIPESCQDVQVRVIEMVVRFALDIGWVGESLWTFVDMAVRTTGVVVDGVQDLLQHSVGGDDGVAATLPERSWKTWLARAEAYWSIAGVGDCLEKSQM